MTKNSIIRPALQLGLWILAGGLIWASFRQVSFQEVFTTLQAIQWWQYGLLIVANGLVLLFKFVRWWIILRYQQYNIPFLQLAGIRQAAFAISTVTPGPQFGGEPFQVWALMRRYDVPTKQGVASVTLDRLTELAVSFSFIVAGALVSVQYQLNISPLTLPIAGLVLMMPLAYLLGLQFNRHPISYLVRLSPRLLALVNPSEREMSRFLQQGKNRLGVLLLISSIGFVVQIGEYALTLMILGLPVQLMSLITLFTIARLSLLVPTPAALGAVESGQVLAFATLGLNPALAVSLTILIRIRDVLLILLGLSLVGKRR